MKIYTKTGDDGTTGVLGNKRVRKDSLLIEAVGTVDEANSILGIQSLPSDLSHMVNTIQEILFEIGADLASLEKTKEYQINKFLRKDATHWLESQIDMMEEKLPPLKKFILPRGVIHHARSVVRRSERRVASLSEFHDVKEILIVLNRLSDFLFVMARYVAVVVEKKEEVYWR